MNFEISLIEITIYGIVILGIFYYIASAFLKLFNQSPPLRAIMLGSIVSYRWVARRGRILLYGYAKNESVNG